MTTKTIYLVYQRSEHNDKGEHLDNKPMTVAFSYSDDYFGPIPIKMIIDEFDEAYKKLRKQLIEELEDERNV